MVRPPFRRSWTSGEFRVHGPGMGPLDHCRRRIPGQEKASPEIRVEIGQALLVCAGEIGEERRGIACHDRYCVHGVACDLRHRRGRERAEIVDPASDQILHGWRRAAIRNMGDINADRRIELPREGD